MFYSGNLGIKQGLPDFVEVFRAAAESWRLRIHGGGVEAQRLRSEQRPGDRVELGPVLAESEYIRALLGATACLVTQRPGVGANFLPSKLLPALATGTPVLAVCDPGSPLGVEVEEGGFGVVVPPGDSKRLRAVLGAWQSEPERLRRASIRAMERAGRYRRETVLQRYEDELSALAGHGGHRSVGAAEA